MIINLDNACELLANAVKDTKLEVNMSGHSGVSIHWCGVVRLDCTPLQAAKAIPLFKRLEALGAKDC